MRILLVATNRHNRWMSKEEVRPLPIGLAYVAAYVDPDRHSLRVIDLMFSDDYLGEVERVVQEFQPELIGISIRNLDNGSFVNPQSALPVTREVIGRIRECSQAVIACGGPAFSTLPEDCFRYLEPDVGLAGDAAETFAELADLLSESREYEHLSGVISRRNGEIVTSPHRAASGLARPPRLDDLDLDQYRKAGFGVGVITKLGWYSSTVPSPNPEDEWRIVRPVPEVLEEIKRLQSSHNLNEFFFIDQQFNRPMDYAKDLCRAIIDEGLSIRWNTNIRPEGIDRELLSLMVASGCQMVLLGGASLSYYSNLDEGNEERVQLATELSELQKLCDLCHSEGLTYAITQGFGEPGETSDTMRAKLAFLSTAARSERHAMATLRIGNRLLPGTDLTRLAVEEGLIEDADDLLMPVFYVAPRVRDEIQETLEAAVQGNPTWSIM